MKIFIDFDDVLFNTMDFNEQFEGAFGSCGVDENLFRSTYKKARQREGIYNYSFDRHLSILEHDYGHDSKAIESAVKSLSYGADQFIFDDAEDFLKTLQKGNHELYLVSFGAPSIQEGKVDGSGLRKYFKKIIVGEISKGEKVKELLGDENGENSLFLDDRAAHIQSVKKNCPLITTILVGRSEGRYHDKRTDSCDHVVAELTEVSDIIKNFPNF